MLIKLLGNILRNPGEAKYRSLKKGNKTIKAALLDLAGARGVILALGYSNASAEEFLFSSEDLSQLEFNLTVIKEALKMFLPAREKASLE